MGQQSYPVFVEYTERHLVWVEAVDAEDAASQVAPAPWEFTGKGQAFDGWSAASAPKDSYDWDDVYGYFGGAEDQDAHVSAHRAEMFRRDLAAKQAACHEARHPDVTVYSSGSIWCKGCTEYLYIAALGRAS